MLHVKSTQEIGAELSRALKSHLANRERIADLPSANDQKILVEELLLELQRHTEVLSLLLDDALQTLGHLALLTGHYELTAGGGVDLPEPD
jgi:hypothetical protein